LIPSKGSSVERSGSNLRTEADATFVEEDQKRRFLLSDC